MIDGEQAHTKLVQNSPKTHENSLQLIFLTYHPRDARSKL